MAVFTLILTFLLCSLLSWDWAGNNEACAIQYCHSKNSQTFLPVVNIFEAALKAASVCIFSFVNGFTCKFTK